MKIQNRSKLVLSVLTFVFLLGSALAVPGVAAENSDKTEAAACCKECCCKSGGENAEKGECCKSADAKCEHGKCSKAAKGEQCQHGEKAKSSCCAHSDKKGDEPSSTSAR